MNTPRTPDQVRNWLVANGVRISHENTGLSSFRAIIHNCGDFLIMLRKLDLSHTDWEAFHDIGYPGQVLFKITFRYQVT